MSDVEVMATLLADDEILTVASKRLMKNPQPDDVYFIPKLGKLTPDSLSYLYSIFAQSRVKLIISGVKELEKWIPSFNNTDVVWYEVDDETVIFDKYE